MQLKLMFDVCGLRNIIAKLRSEIGTRRCLKKGRGYSFLILKNDVGGVILIWNNKSLRGYVWGSKIKKKKSLRGYGVGSKVEGIVGRHQIKME